MLVAAKKFVSLTSLIILASATARADSMSTNDLTSYEEVTFAKLVKKTFVATPRPSEEKLASATAEKTSPKKKSSRVILDLSLAQLLDRDASDVVAFMKPGKLRKPAENIAKEIPTAIPAVKENFVSLAVVPPIAAPVEVQKVGDIEVRVAKSTPAAKLNLKKSNPIVLAAPVDKFRIVVEGKAVRFEPKSLSFIEPNRRVSVELSTNSSKPLMFGHDVNVFVRNPEVVRWDAQASQLQALKAGQTETYVVVAGKMYIVPVAVGQTDNKQPFLVASKDLFSLEGIIPDPKSMVQARMPGLDESQTALPTSKPVMSIEQSEAQVEQTQANDIEKSRQYARANRRVAYSKMAIQVIDERSREYQNEVYPVVGARVHIVGTPFTGITNATGHVVLRDIPQAGHFMVYIDDPNGGSSGIVPTVAEVKVGRQNDQGVVRVRAMRYSAQNTFTGMVGQVQNANLGALCGRVENLVNGRNVPQAGITAQIDVRAAGPFYFTQFGFLDATGKGTGADGKFCYFNVEPGPVLLHLSSGSQLVFSAVSSVFAGKFVDENFQLVQSTGVETRIVSAATAAEQRGNDKLVANSFKPVDFINLMPLGTGESMHYDDEGKLTWGKGGVVHGGRVWAAIQASEFEQTLHGLNVDEDAEEQVTSLLPRGFLEDMAEQASVSIDSSLGSVVVDYGALSGQGQSLTNVRLVNETDHDIGEGFYYADQPITKAVFFNVPPGKYQLMVETADHYWLAAETLFVYDETITVVQTGNRPEFHAPAVH